jgi:hypothetical protein
MSTFLATAGAQTTWYVDGSVPGPGTGTAVDPYRSIHHASLQPTTVTGDTILVAPGVYVEKVGISKGITIKSAAGPLATVIRRDVSGTVVSIGSSSFNPLATIEGFTIVMSGHGIAVHVNDGMIRRCIVVGEGLGVGLGAVDEIRAEHCTVQGFEIGCTGVVHGGEVKLANSIVTANGTDLVDASHVYTWYNSSSYYGPSGLGPAGFFDGPGHDFHLLATSGCIDAGDPNAPLDPDGSRADMGALPYDPTYAPFTIYCTAKTNSLGCTPAIGAVHNASLTSDRPFWINCSNQLNNRNGFLFYGFAPKSTPYQGGFLCVKSPTRRTQLQNSGGNAGPDDCSGTFAFDFNALVRGGSDPLLQLGIEVFCQYWARDPAASFHTNRSDALHFPVQI